jgi:hypothetical protein
MMCEHTKPTQCVRTMRQAHDIYHDDGDRALMRAAVTLAVTRCSCRLAEVGRAANSATPGQRAALARVISPSDWVEIGRATMHAAGSALRTGRVDLAQTLVAHMRDYVRPEDARGFAAAPTTEHWGHTVTAAKSEFYSLNIAETWFDHLIEVDALFAIVLGRSEGGLA